MKILQVSQEVPPETAWGGIGTYIGVLTPALATAGAEVHVLSVVPGQSRSTTVTPEGVVVHRAPLERIRGVGRATGLVETWGRWTLARSVARELDALDFEPDVVESPNWMAEGLALARRGSHPMVVRLHSWASQIFPSFSPADGRPSVRSTWDHHFAVRMEERLVRAADVVIGTRVQLDDAGPRLGLDPDALRIIAPPVPGVPARPGPPPRPPAILFVGRLEARKGPETLVRALPAIAAAIPDVQLVLTGRDSTADGIPSYAAWLRGLAAELGVGANLSILHDRDNDDVAELRRHASVCVMPSRWESFGYVAAEGSAAGRPVVASDVGGLRDVVVDGETGYLVPAEDHVAWAAALTKLLSNPERALTMGARGAEVMADRYGPDRIAADTLSAYELARARHAAAHGESHIGDDGNHCVPPVEGALTDSRS